MDKIKCNKTSENQAILSNEPEIWELEEFSTHIFATYNATKIQGIIIDEDHVEKIRNLSRDMKYHYNNVQSVSSTAYVGHYYAVFDNVWHRVKCIDCDFENKNTTVFFIDRGDEDVFPMENLEPLDSKFYSLPAQTITLSLDGLEILKDNLEIQTLLDDLLVEKDAYIKVVGVKTENNNIPILSVELFIEEHEKEINVNEIVLEEMLKSIVNPKIFISPDKVAQKVSLTYLGEKAIFVEINSEGIQYLEVLMNDLTEYYLNNKKYVHKQVFEVDLSKLYVTLDAEDNKLYRVKIVSSENENNVQVKYIDVGNTKIIKEQDLILLEGLSKLLAKYPEQAIEVILHKISPLLFNNNMVKYLYKMAEISNLFYMKVVGKMQGCPVVQLSVRAENNSIISINDELITKIYIENPLPDFPLKSPSLPEDGSFFDVYVTMAPRPDDITVQPLATMYKLNELMDGLLDVCESFSGPHLTPNSIKVGNLYAAQDDDDAWYRACVCRIINKNTYLVYACDYGDYNIAPLKNLQPLQEEFYELPYQAIKAKLNGVHQEIIDNWSADYSSKLNELIVQKNFVSCIESREKDTAHTRVKLHLALVDTNSDEDVYIADIINRCNENAN